MPVIINEMIANVRPDSETVAVDNDRPQASGSDEAAQKLRHQMNIDQERKERLQID
jgi:hypothetical protein